MAQAPRYLPAVLAVVVLLLVALQANRAPGSSAGERPLGAGCGGVELIESDAFPIFGSRTPEGSTGQTSGTGRGERCSTACSSPLGSFGPGNWPGPCWRPYAETSPFNQRLPAVPRIDPNSAAIVRKVASWGGWFSDMYAGAADTSDDWEHPIYFSKASDPLYTVARAPGGYDSDYWGTRVHIPSGARAAGGSDGHLAVIEQPSASEWDLWNVRDARGRKLTKLPAGGGTIYAKGFGKAKVDGSGLNIGSGDANAARWGLLAGIIRAQEMQGGEINHALYVYAKCDSGQIVYPASGHGARCSDPTNAPHQGTRFQLNMSDAQIDALAVPAWKKTILRAIAHYGMYVGDTGGSPMDLQFESGSGYTSFGYADPMASFAEQAGIPRSSGGRYYFDLASGVDWARYLRVIDPCVAKGTC